MYLGFLEGGIRRFLPAFPLGFQFAAQLRKQLCQLCWTGFSLRLGRLKGVAPFYHSVTKLQWHIVYSAFSFISLLLTYLVQI